MTCDQLIAAINKADSYEAIYMVIFPHLANDALMNELETRLDEINSDEVPVRTSPSWLN